MKKLTKLFVLAVVMSIFMFVLTPPAYASYSSKVNSFINDSRWCDGIAWNDDQQPKMPGLDQFWGCAAYACDFARYVWGASSYHDGIQFYDFNEIRDGDIIHTGGHYYVVLQRTGNTLWTAEGNVIFSGFHRTWISTSHYNAGSSAGCGGFVKGWHNPNYEPYSGMAYLDVNGMLDGQENGTLLDYGTFDVYINGTLVADDVNDYYVEWPLGTGYNITDIKGSTGTTYEGVYSGSLSGTIGTAGSWACLSFESYATLDVQGMLDGAASDNTEGFGTFDVYINGSADACGVTDYVKQWPLGTAYEIRNVQTADGKYCSNANALSGTLGRGVNNATLIISTIQQADQDWCVVDELPAYIDPSTVEIEYNNHYEQTAETAPGADWTKLEGSGVVSYVNDGDVYESDFELATSDTCVHVGTYYYHYCGSSKSDVNYYYTSAYNTYHNIGDINQYYVTYQHADYENAAYTFYRVNWVSGQWAGGAATCASGKPNDYYRRYQYQNRKAVTNYLWFKDSGWTSEPDSAAASTVIRYRAKQYEVSFDANGGVNAPEKQVKLRGVDLVLTDAVPEMPAYTFKGWNTQADGTGTAYAAGSVYALDENVTLFAQWTPASAMVLPADLTVIEERAFANIDAMVVEIPDGCKTIGKEAFLNCRNLVQLHVPASVTDIAFDAFDGCEKLTIYTTEGSTAYRFAKAMGIAYEIIG